MKAANMAAAAPGCPAPTTRRPNTVSTAPAIRARTSSTLTVKATTSIPTSVVALDAKTGKLKWYRQEITQDVWDYDSPYEVMLFRKDGKDLIVHMNKSGYVFVLDKNSGSIENIWPISDLKNFVKDIDQKTGELIGRVELPMNKETLICPSTFGARSWNSGAYNPKTGLWYNNVLDFCGYLKPVAQKDDPKDYGTGHTGSNDFGRLVMAPDGRKPGQLERQRSNHRRTQMDV